MKLRVSILLLLFLSAPALGKSEKKITYVGDGRYVCSGSRCDEFDARERKYQDKQDRERRQNYRDDEREERKYQDKQDRERRQNYRDYEREERNREHESDDYRKRNY